MKDSSEPKTESTKFNSAAGHAAKANSHFQIESSETNKIELTFEAKKCIHSRHCVTELPRVFKANTPGKWLFPENTDIEILTAVIRECPSGALQYRRKDGGLNEPEPEVNLMRIRENGPYAFLGKLVIDGKNAGTRAALCRCGDSKNKPYCDGTHKDTGFFATGEPPTLSGAPLKVRNGEIKIERVKDGPLQVTGNLEICTGTGRVVQRVERVALCRCGKSKTNLLCDFSHIGAGFTDDPKESRVSP